MSKKGLALVTEDDEIKRRQHEANEADKVITTIAEHDEKKWVPLGRASVIVTSNEYWRTHYTDEAGNNFTSWNSYINNRFGAGRSTAYRALQLMEIFGHLSDELLKKIPVTNAVLLLNLSEKNRLKDEWLARAQTMKHGELEELVYDSLEGAAEPEKKRKIVFKAVTKSLAAVVERALNVAGWIDDTDIQNEQLERIVADFLDDVWQDEANMKSKSPLSNWQAYQQRNRIAKRDADA